MSPSAWCSWFGRSLAFALIAALPLGAAAQSGAEVYQVIKLPSVYQPLPIAGGAPMTQHSAVTGDYGVQENIPLPFPVSFFGVTHTSYSMVANGFIVLGGGSISTTTYAPSTWRSSSAPNNVVALWWMDGVCPNGTQSQVIGPPGNRSFVVQMHCHRYSDGGSMFQVQAWFHENSTNISMKYGTAPAGGVSHTAAVGIENSTGTFGYTGLPCGVTCRHTDFPTGFELVYTQRPDLAVAAGRADEIAYSGRPIQLEADIRNTGGFPAENFSVRFWLSVDNVIGNDIDLVTTAPLATLAAGQQHTFTAEPVLPVSLVPGVYHLVAEVDPGNTVLEGSETNNKTIFGPVLIGEPRPDLAVGTIRVPAGATAGGTFSLEWTARNVGNLDATSVPYALVLSANDVITGEDDRIFSGIFSANAFTDTEVIQQVQVPPSTPGDYYWLGIVIDPDNSVPELDDLNNIGVSDEPFSVSNGNLVLPTSVLPPAEIASHYCILLEASGGDGSYTWALESGALPPGLTLAEERDERNPARAPLATLLCGQPGQIGSFDFTLRVTSGTSEATGTFHLDVNSTGMLLMAIERQLKQATFRQDFEEPLQAVGGKAPYSWKVVDGALPAGLELTAGGVIKGRAQADGEYAFTVEVRDVSAATSRANLSLVVVPPANLVCGNTSLPSRLAGASIEEQLIAAGGEQPHSWSTRGSRRLPSSNDGGETFNDAPPNLRLSPSGAVSGQVRAAGSYLWEVEVRDRKGASADCLIAFDIRYDQNITLLTHAIPVAYADVHYRVPLQAVGGEGELRWSVGSGQRLPDGLSLSEDGVISGVIAAATLAGQKSITFAFFVEVEDAANRINAMPLSITVHLKEDKYQAPTVPEAKGCSTGGVDPSLLGFGAALGLAALLRRRR